MEQGDNRRIRALLEAMEQGRAQFEAIMEKIADGAKAGPAFAVDEIYDLPPGERFRRLPADDSGVQLDLDVAAFTGTAAAAGNKPCNRIAAGDNLDYMVWLLQERQMAGKIQLIYVDPPFFSGAKYLASVQITGRDGTKSPLLKVGAYEDKWGHDLESYLEMLCVRFWLMRELLADTGCLWVHLDWHGSHYVKMMLDEIFGHDHFVNEVAWTYKSGGASKRSFAKKHDTLLFYSKTNEYTFHQLKEKSYNREFKPYHFKGVEEFQDELGWYTMVNMKDVWNIDMVGRTSSERMGYATQKPEKLLERIVEACTDPGDLCADFFAGTGTLGAVCGRTGRPWILCDEGSAAIGSQILRMADLADSRTPFLVERPVLPYEVRPQTTVQAVIRDDHLMLERCQPDLTQVQERDRETVSGFIGSNSLDLVSFWSVDARRQETQTEEDDTQEPVHIARRLLSGDDIVALPGSGEAAGIHIVGYDIFGGRFVWEHTPRKTVQLQRAVQVQMQKQRKKQRTEDRIK